MSIKVQIQRKLDSFLLDISFQSECRRIGILGASGCGKSMTLKSIAGIETPDQGHIEAEGRTLFDRADRINLKPQKRNVGYLFQNYALFPTMTVEKNIAAMKSEFSATASHMGHNPRVAEAMVDKTHGYPDYAEPGEILSLSDGQAKELGISEGTANSPEEALKLFSLGDASVQYEEKSWKDSIIGILQNEYVRMVVIALILMAIFVEIKTAGIGVGIITAIVLGGLLFLSGEDSLGDSLIVLGAFIGSLFFVGMEILSPGVGIFGVLGVLLLFGSLFYTLGATIDSVYILAGGTVLSLVLFYFVGKRLPKSRLAAKFMLTTQSTKEKGYSSQSDKSKYLYQRGKTITILRPAGTIRIGKERVDAVSAGSFIERDVEVRVVEVEGTRVVVEPVPKRSE